MVYHSLFAFPHEVAEARFHVLDYKRIAHLLSCQILERLLHRSRLNKTCLDLNDDDHHNRQRESLNRLKKLAGDSIFAFELETGEEDNLSPSPIDLKNTLFWHGPQHRNKKTFSLHEGYDSDYCQVIIETKLPEIFGFINTLFESDRYVNLINLAGFQGQGPRPIRHFVSDVSLPVKKKLMRILFNKKNCMELSYMPSCFAKILLNYNLPFANLANLSSASYTFANYSYTRGRGRGSNGRGGRSNARGRGHGRGSNARGGHGRGSNARGRGSNARGRGSNARGRGGNARGRTARNSIPDSEEDLLRLFQVEKNGESTIRDLIKWNEKKKNSNWGLFYRTNDTTLSNSLYQPLFTSADSFLAILDSGDVSETMKMTVKTLGHQICGVTNALGINYKSIVGYEYGNPLPALIQYLSDTENNNTADLKTVALRIVNEHIERHTLFDICGNEQQLSNKEKTERRKKIKKHLHIDESRVSENEALHKDIANLINDTIPSNEISAMDRNIYLGRAFLKAFTLQDENSFTSTMEKDSMTEIPRENILLHCHQILLQIQKNNEPNATTTTSASTTTTTTPSASTTTTTTLKEIFQILVGNNDDDNDDNDEEEEEEEEEEDDLMEIRNKLNSFAEKHLAGYIHATFTSNNNKQKTTLSWLEKNFPRHLYGTPNVYEFWMLTCLQLDIMVSLPTMLNLLNDLWITTNDPNSIFEFVRVATQRQNPQKRIIL